METSSRLPWTERLKRRLTFHDRRVPVTMVCGLQFNTALSADVHMLTTTIASLSITPTVCEALASFAAGIGVAGIPLMATFVVSGLVSFAFTAVLAYPVALLVSSLFCARSMARFFSSLPDRFYATPVRRFPFWAAFSKAWDFHTRDNGYSVVLSPSPSPRIESTDHGWWVMNAAATHSSVIAEEVEDAWIEDRDTYDAFTGIRSRRPLETTTGANE